MNTTLTVLSLMCALMVLVTVWAYDRALARARTERDEAIADCELFSELLIEHARDRHPARGQQYGGGNLRVVK